MVFRINGTSMGCFTLYLPGSSHDSLFIALAAIQSIYLGPRQFLPWLLRVFYRQQALSVEVCQRTVRCH